MFSFNATLFLLYLLFLIVILLFAFIIPQFTSVYEQLNADLPLYTQMLLDAGDWLNNNLYFSIGVYSFIFSILFIFFNKIDNGKSVRDNFDNFFEKLSIGKQAIVYFFITILISVIIGLALVSVYLPIFKFGNTF